MRILAISSQVAYGPVGLTAAVPALQALRHEVLAVPTITLSNHPGHGKPAGFRTAPEDISRILETLDGLGVLQSVGAVLTGYFASPEQVKAVAAVLIGMKSAKPELFILVDPVIGDEGGLYVPQPVAEAIRDQLVPLATCITPNRFELEWLSGSSVTNEAEAIAAALRLGTMEGLATSIPAGIGQLSTMLITSEATHTLTSPRLAHVPHGTGDFLSGLYLASRVATASEDAFHAAMKSLARAIAISAGTNVLDVAGALHSSNPIQQNLSARFLGIDMCRGSWCVVAWDGHSQGSPTSHVVKEISSLALMYVDTAAIDIPIGLPDIIPRGGRLADQMARKYLGKKGPAVFPAPARATIAATTNKLASSINRKNSDPEGIGIPAVSFGLFPKLREIDAFVTPVLQSKLFEVHPEVCFAIMNGGESVSSSKKSPAGQGQRRNLLANSGFPIDRLVLPEGLRGKWGWDDILDACACAWSAKRIYENCHVRFPADPPLDAKGLRMEINA